MSGPYGHPQGEVFFAIIDANEPEKHWRYVVTQSHSYTAANGTHFTDHCLVIGITSIKDNQAYDSSCILNESHFSFLEKDSYVYYAKAQLLPYGNVRTLIENYGAHKYYQIPFDSSTHNLIVNGLRASDFTDEIHLAFYEDSIKARKKPRL